ncbi:hypothetical protein GCM10022236_41180 [Microlunatus ginsengisoli]|uniref:Zinc transporter ZupT n=1 Tax=Microlunatus ginsengisoli TaxID=363863 RepID=A0ABP7AK42_9ACTN
MHNFAEGLAIGSSAAAGDLSLALLPVIGFGLHNATEGFGIVAQAADPPLSERLSANASSGSLYWWRSWPSLRARFSTW